MATMEFLADREIYEQVILRLVPSATRYLWVGTADIKDLHVTVGRRDHMVPFLKVIADLLEKGVEVRLLHAKEAGPNFRADFDRYPVLAKSLERMLCPRVHFKCVIADGVRAYMGSANLTGAGMGAKSPLRRNFENGVLTDDPALLTPLSAQFDAVWRGEFCSRCGRRAFCADCPLTD